MDGEFFSRLFIKKMFIRFLNLLVILEEITQLIASNKFDNWDDIVKYELEYERSNGSKIHGFQIENRTKFFYF